MASPADVLQRAERAADQADARARDADRIGRWTVNVALGLAAVLLAAVLGLYADAADARAERAAIRDAIVDPADRLPDVN